METFLPVFFAAIGFCAGISAWISYALTGNAEIARLAAYWGGFVALEFLLIVFLIIAILSSLDEYAPCLAVYFIVCGFIGGLLGFAICSHYCIITGKSLSMLALARITLAAALTGAISPVLTSLYLKKRKAISELSHSQRK
ncbi:hypothetical protein IT084_15440 [Desulfallas sp. Bu1-1]|uniref:hypothetical protein n=1 Tax=Desulfallas sp. Bu1-1 TaxID=2787620 RepID=UPI00189F1A57|nr:hypothetical protein [Desulfallas sp. Bu1-1]MBF7084347.1 hypothetical protein [Desulfallas sp. Bu1-1]